MRDCVHACKPPSGDGPGSGHDVLDAIRLSTFSRPVCKPFGFSAGFSSEVDSSSCNASGSADRRVEPLLPGAPARWSMAQVQVRIDVEVFRFCPLSLCIPQRSLTDLR